MQAIGNDDPGILGQGHRGLDGLKARLDEFRAVRVVSMEERTQRGLPGLLEQSRPRLFGQLDCRDKWSLAIMPRGFPAAAC